MLSDLTNTPHFAHCCPQTAALMTIDTISFVAMPTPAQDSGHSTWNQWPLSVTAPQPHVPEASEVTTCVGASGGMIHCPFHPCRKDAHQCKSDLKSTVNLIWCLGCFAIVIRSIMRRRNVRPGTTTIATWLRCPMSDCSSLLDDVFLPRQARTSQSMRVSLSPGRLSVMARVSTYIPNNVSWVAGPCFVCSYWHSQLSARVQCYLQRLRTRLVYRRPP